MVRKNIEFVDLKTIAERLGYSRRYLENKWSELLPQPVSIGPNRAKRWVWSEVEAQMLQPK